MVAMAMTQLYMSLNFDNDFGIIRHILITISLLTPQKAAAHLTPKMKQSTQ